MKKRSHISLRSIFGIRSWIHSGIHYWIRLGILNLIFIQCLSISQAQEQDLHSQDSNPKSINENKEKSQDPKVKPQKPKYIHPEQATGTSYDDFYKAFKKVWRKWEIDELGDNPDGPSPAVKLFGTVHVYDLKAQCNGKALYLFDCDGTYVVDTNMNVRNLGLVAAGTAGIRKILVGLDKENHKLEILLDDTILEFEGVEADQKECPNLLALYSGFKFKDSKANSEYGLSKMTYNKKSKKYVASRIRTPDKSVEIERPNEVVVPKKSNKKKK